MSRVRWIAFVAALIAGAQPAWATIENLSTYKKANPGKPASCKTCHENPVGRKDDLNAYGKKLQQLSPPANPKKLRIEDYKGVEPTADGAGKTSLVPEKRARILQAHLERWVEPSQAWAAEQKAEYVGSETCAACHAKETKEFEHSTHARIRIPVPGTADAVPGTGVRSQGCESCHGPGSLHAAAGGGRGVGGIINPRKDPSVCFSCHMDKKAEFQMPFRHPVLEGKMSCSDCHSAHGEDVRPWSATSLAGVNEACFKCHKEQRGPFVWEHEALREGCATCHKPHGSVNDKMLVARDNNLCLRCHTQMNFPTIGKQAHGGRLPQGTCFSAGCHTAVHGSNFDDHLRY